MRQHMAESTLHLGCWYSRFLSLLQDDHPLQCSQFVLRYAQVVPKHSLVIHFQLKDEKKECRKSLLSQTCPPVNFSNTIATPFTEWPWQRSPHFLSFTVLALEVDTEFLHWSTFQL